MHECKGVVVGCGKGKFQISTCPFVFCVCYSVIGFFYDVPQSLEAHW